MAYAAKFYNSTSTIDVSNGTSYNLGLDFVPPAAVSAANMTSGLSANRYGGAIKVDEKYQPRQWSFNIRVMGSSDADVTGKANNLVNLLSVARKDNPVYFAYRSNSSLPAPLWGQFGQWKIYTVQHATYAVGDSYASGNIRARVVMVQVNLAITPFADGTQQRVLNASGGIFEDVYGRADGTSRGLAIFEATTNKFTNPVFGHATYDNGWTTGAELIVAKNTDPNFCLPGLLQSVLISSVGSATNTFTQSINVGNTNKHSISCIVKLRDNSAPSGDVFLFKYGANILNSPTVISLGNGFYRVETLNFDGVNAATAIGVHVLINKSFYLCGIQLEEKVYATPLCYGDLLGCAWTGTAHASTSTRTKAVVAHTRTNDILPMAHGSISMIWRPYYSNTFATDEFLFAVTDAANSEDYLRAYFESADDKFYFSDGTYDEPSAAQTFSAGDVLYLTFTWGNSGFNMYKNGVNIITKNAYALPSAANSAKLWIGCRDDYQCNGTLMGYDVYDDELTAAQVLAMYNEQAAVVAGGGRVSTIPWLWTKDGDGIVDNVDDTNRDNWAVYGGIPGSVAAKYLHYIDVGTTAGTALWYGAFDLPEGVFYLPTTQWYFENGPTADASCSGGNYEAVTSPNDLSVDGERSTYGYTKYNFFIRMAKAATTGSITATPSIELGAQVIAGQTKTLALTTDYKLYYLGDILLKNQFPLGYSLLGYSDPVINFNIDFTAAFTVNVDYWQAVPGKMCKITWGGAPDVVGFDGDNAQSLSLVAGVAFGYNGVVGGDKLDLLPGRYNILWGIIGENGVANVITETQAFTTLITPRWSLL